ncbi:MAG: UDP-N-acetylmuramate dehydrogenase [Oscillospiraceae bacterium]|nr:UDP-N-acetylmuramate dehydrogenase [Oscillospiraceae bacterium]
MQVIIAELTAAGLRVLESEPLALHTSFRIGGPVRAMVLPNGEAEIVLAAQILRETGIRPIIIGNGSNLLADDGPIDAVVLKTQNGASAEVQQLSAHTIYAPAGMLLSRVATAARDLELTGLEFAHGIPGTLGGAIYMNAGAYCGEMAQVVSEVRYLDENLVERTISGDEAGFAYRHSRFSDTDAIILGATLTLSPGDRAEIQAKMDDLAGRRKASQPLEWPSGGSTFKRPKEGYAAALIEEADLKGFVVGGAQVSEKHAGFVINRGGATCDDVLRLMEHIQETVYQRTGILLEPEIKRIP